MAERCSRCEKRVRHRHGRDPPNPADVQIVGEITGVERPGAVVENAVFRALFATVRFRFIFLTRATRSAKFELLSNEALILHCWQR